MHADGEPGPSASVKLGTCQLPQHLLFLPLSFSSSPGIQLNIYSLNSFRLPLMTCRAFSNRSSSDSLTPSRKSLPSLDFMEETQLKLLPCQGHIICKWRTTGMVLVLFALLQMINFVAPPRPPSSLESPSYLPTGHGAAFSPMGISPLFLRQGATAFTSSALSRPQSAWL